MISFKCPSCGKQYSVKDEYGGKRTTCQKCQTRMLVPMPAAVTKTPDWLDNPPPQRVDQLEEVAAVTRSSTVQCPFCDSEISASAKKCKHCGETIDVALRAAEEAKRAAENKPMVFMNAGGASSSASSSASASSGDYYYRPRPSSGLGTASLVLGIVSLMFAFIPCIGMFTWPLSLLGLGLGAGALMTKRGTGLGIAGLATNGLAILVALIWLVFIGAAASNVPSTSPTAPPARRIR